MPKAMLVWPAAFGLAAGVVRFVRRLMGQRHFAVFFIPCKPRGDSDGVSALAPLIRKRLRNSDCATMVGEHHPTALHVARELGVRSVPERLVVFAHPSADERGFAFGSRRDQTHEEVLLPNWWQPAGQYRLVIAHTCRGANVLSRESWQQVFPSWVSYRDDICQFLGTSDGCDCWAKIGRNIVEIARTSETAEEAVQSVRAVYEGAIDSLSGSYDPRRGDALNLMYLQQCLESVTSSH
jgi:hypothetical protein